jgi:hypothetical protein
MMHNKVPGLYYFFLGEEVGGIGSNLLSGDYTKTSYLENIKVRFFDRKTVSVITRQVEDNVVLMNLRMLYVMNITKVD